ncbi:hypothetical protein [Rhodococcus jostii]
MSNKTIASRFTGTDLVLLATIEGRDVVDMFAELFAQLDEELTR